MIVTKAIGFLCEETMNCNHCAWLSRSAAQEMADNIGYVAGLEAELTTLRAHSAEAFAGWLRKQNIVVDDALKRFNEEVGAK